MTDSHPSPSRAVWTTWLAAAGAVLAILGLVAVVAAKRAADAASRAASAHAFASADHLPHSLMVRVDPAAAHQVAPDYTLSGIAIGVVGLGIVTLVVAAIAQLRRWSGGGARPNPARP